MDINIFIHVLLENFFFPFQQLFLLIFCFMVKLFSLFFKFGLPLSLMYSNNPSNNEISVILFINNERCEGISFSVERDAPVDIPVEGGTNTSAIRKAARRYNGLYELFFSMELEENKLSAFARGRIVGHALLPSGAIHYLGPLMPPGEPVDSAMFVEDIPDTIQLRFTLDMKVPVGVSAVWPAELLLADHVMAIIDNDDLSGSVPSSHVQNLVRELPFYNRGMRRFNNWSNFVRFFAMYYHSWELIQYSEEMHEHLGFSKLMLAGEMRMVSKKFLNSYMRADKERDIIRYEAFLEFQHLLLSFTGPFDGTRRSPRLSNDAFRLLGESRSFRTLNTVNYVRILRLVALDPERYVLFDAHHPIRIDWKHSEETTPGLVEMCPV
ncbi:hypothetical protein, conserved [Trypanosoma cruzi]|uniref:Uncharacterized protein n=2 Tax=Trypanosoma cruzi TaxID=5693 RepID=Q4DNZ1_TRYCC|nr:hypothetical protein, conserved [Trypanosoma cruzi]EAN94253.1 hypothetical protein, conserved [Trypanosoma cruzi]|eukprot:XP_816104.1 hypothetical protein [Trypanosoma cruzi strain CL Brener]